MNNNILEEAKTINASLTRTHQQLSWTINQTDSAAQILQGDELILKETLENHEHKLKLSLISTRKRLERIKRSAKYEKLATIISFVFFGCVVSYIVLSRLHVFSFIYSWILCSLFRENTSLYNEL